MGIYDGFPKTLRVGQYDYSIEIKDKINDEDDCGTHERGNRINLRHNQENAICALDTALHEINHAICDVFGLEDGGTIDVERLVVALTSAWIMVYRDNPDFVAWLYRMIPPRHG